MPANLTAQYRTAEASYRSARTVDEKRAALEEMLSAIPKHKGTEKMQADIKRRLARLRHEVERRSKKRTHTVHVDPEGAAQVVLLGPPNSGKSSILAALTRAEPAIAEYPFTTTRPQAGMLNFEDVQIQLVDLPPISAAHMEPWFPNVVQGADAALLVADPSTPGVLAGIEEICDRLAGLHLPLVGELPEASEDHLMPLPSLLVINKADAVNEDDLEVIEELYDDRFPHLRFSATQRTGRQALKVQLWRMLQLVRVYTRPPGKKVERSDPIVLHAGSTVLDLAASIHTDLPDKLNHARVWGGTIQGQRVARDFELRDRDVVEIAT